MVMRSVILGALLSGLLTGCLDDPELATCAEFPVDTAPAVCGSPCDIYCEALLDTCYEFVGGDNPEAVCAAACLEITQPGTFGEEGGDTLACRTRQAVRARDDSSHCLAALFDGGGVCVSDPCDDYCFAMADNCGSLFQSYEECRAACQFYPTGGSADTGNSLECRITYARAAVGDPVLCGAAGIASDGTCGGACEGYCTQVMTTCVGDAQVFVDNEDCMRQCSFLNQGGAFDDWRADGDSVQCRAWHAAAPAQLDPGSHCAHASLFNDFQCGTTCSTWCSMCTAQFPDEETCAADCAARVGVGEALFPDPNAPLQCQ